MDHKIPIIFCIDVEPGLKIKKRPFNHELYTASLPDYDNIPREPYHPSRVNFAEPDPSRDGALWVIPMSTGTVTYKFGRLEALMKRLLAPEELKARPVTLNPSKGVHGFPLVMENLLGSLARPYLAMVLRSDVCSETPSGRHNLECVKRNMDYVMNHPLAGSFVFSTPPGGDVNDGLFGEAACGRKVIVNEAQGCGADFKLKPQGGDALVPGFFEMEFLRAVRSRCHRQWLQRWN